MTKYKKIAIITLILLSALSLVFIFYSSRQETRNKQGFGPPIIDLGAPASKVNIKLNINKNSLDIPTNLPVYSVDSTPLSPTETSQIAVRFGFNSNPVVLQDVNQGQVYLWSDNSGDLRVIPSQRIIDYKTNLPTQAKNSQFASNETIILAAQSALSDKQLFFTTPPEFSILRYLSTYGETYRVVDKNLAEIADVFYVEKIGQYPIINTTVDAGTINVKLDRDNHTVSIFIDQTGPFFEIGNQAIKTFSELSSSLSEAKIVSVENVDEEVYSLPEKIKTIEIDKVYISYLQESSKNQVFLQPVFVFEGTTSFVDITGERRATLYLPALKY